MLFGKVKYLYYDGNYCDGYMINSKKNGLFSYYYKLYKIIVK